MHSFPPLPLALQGHLHSLIFVSDLGTSGQILISLQSKLNSKWKNRTNKPVVRQPRGPAQLRWLNRWCPPTATHQPAAGSRHTHAHTHAYLMCHWRASRCVRPGWACSAETLRFARVSVFPRCCETSLLWKASASVYFMSCEAVL